MNRSRSGVALAIVARLPRSGTCKTRLVPPLDHPGAASLSASFIRDTMQNFADVAATTGATPVALYAGDGDEAERRSVFGDVEHVAQRGDDFGERLRNGAADLFDLGFSAVALIDSDSPTLPAASLIRAVRELQADGERAVIGPARDGGYYLLGMKRYDKELFEGIAWSTDAVCAQTTQRAVALGLDVVTLPEWYDVDDGSGLEALRAEFAGEAPAGYAAPHTRARLATLLVRG